MPDGLVQFFGCVNLVVFFIADFFFAYVLHNLKQDHPAIDDCTPETADVDTVAILANLHRVAAPILGSSGTHEEIRDGSSRHTAAVSMDDSANDSSSPAMRERQAIIHKLVIAASFCAPIFSIIQIVSPSSMPWSMFTVPTWLGFLSQIPGLGAAIFYASRATRVSNFVEVSKSQWLSLMWFRLDMMCVMATVMLVGWGDWLVAACLFAVALYLAHRLLVTEKRLSSEMRATQLVREEINLETLTRPKESELGSSGKGKGYDSLRRQ